VHMLEATLSFLLEPGCGGKRQDWSRKLRFLSDRGGFSVLC
jgi:hypothetical protein